MVTIEVFFLQNSISTIRIKNLLETYAYLVMYVACVKLYLLFVTIVIAILIVAIPNVQHYYFLMGQRKTFNFPDVKSFTDNDF